MKLLLVRDLFTDTTTLGKLSIDGNYQCETLEDTDRNVESGGKKIDGKTAIPRGTYLVTIDYSNRFKKDMPHLLDVPQFSGIRIHCGNTSADTEGCILLGRIRMNNNNIGYSRDAFRLFFDKLEAAFEKNDKVTIEVK